MLDKEFLFELSAHFGGEIRLDKASRVLYSTDASMYQIEPMGVVIPKTQEDLISAVELAVKYRIPIIPRGAGSSLGGQVIGEALILDCSRHLDAIIGIDKNSHSATVEPGVVLADLNRAAARLGLMFGPDPASAERATMGGVVGNNATGAHSILYGMTADHLLSADVIAGDGALETWDYSGSSRLCQISQFIRENYSDQIKDRFPRSWRNSAGYRLNYLLPWSPSAPPQWDVQDYAMQGSVYRDGAAVNMAQLLAGSEGTLGVIRRITVNLVSKPKYTMLGILAYQSVASACDDVPRLLEFSPSAIELIPRLIVKLAKSIPSMARQMGWIIADPAAILVVEFSGDHPAQLRDSIRRIGPVIAIAETPDEQTRIWNVRKMGLGILDSQPSAARPVAFIEDCAVPVENLGGFVREVERILVHHQAEGGIYAHASAGCLHIRPILNLRDGEGVRNLRSIAEQVARLTLSLGGSMSSEHGDGLVSGEWIEKTYGGELVTAMRSIKNAVDPYNLLNPRKLFDAPPMDQNLRFGSNYLPTAWTPSLNFLHQGGLAGAIEQCNGQGVCRKSTGVMCPSFQATRDEKYSTRGRANLLRAMISSDSLTKNKISPSVFDALDLCLACKGCTSECPSGVDMPKLKSEFMNEYYKMNHRPVRDYLFGYIHIAADWLSWLSPLIKVINKFESIRKIVTYLLGITPDRPLPIFRSRELPEKKMTSNQGRVVYYLPDVFSHYLEPEVEQASIGLLEKLGYKVIFLNSMGAGTSLLSKGFIPAARNYAVKLLNEIVSFGGDGDVSIVGCEPPEIYAIKNDYVSLLPDKLGQIKNITKNTWLMDEFLIREIEKRNLRVDIFGQGRTDKLNKKITFYPHCHHRAEGPADDGLPTGTAATVALLQKFGFEVSVVDGGCCGMAGTFGYDREHYDLSMKIGEKKLFPTLRDLNISSMVVASGSACRMQIKHGVNVESQHPIVLIWELLKGKL